MKKLTLNWELAHSKTIEETPIDRITASVPGAVQLDYAKALNYKPYYFGLNFRQFDWMEDEYFTYYSTLDFTCSPFECAILTFEGIDYKYQIRINGKVVKEGEGMFTPVNIDISSYSGKKVPLEVVIFPIPKLKNVHKGRSEAAHSCKPASAYGWDWHPRLVPSGIWDEAYIKIFPIGTPTKIDVSYILDDNYNAEVAIETEVCGIGTFDVSIVSENGTVVASEKREVGEKQIEKFIFNVEKPDLWYPRGYGKQPLYTIVVKGNDTLTRKIGFRRSKLVRNVRDTKHYEGKFPSTCLPAPATLEINGVGYKAAKEGKKLNLSLGYSHPVIMDDPEGIESSVDQNKIIIKGIDKEKVGQYAAEIRGKRGPEPYKGKGIKYADETIRRKVGKAGKK